MPELTQIQQSTYDALQARIQSFKDAGRNPPEELLNGSHNFINAILMHQKD